MDMRRRGAGLVVLGLLGVALLLGGCGPNPGARAFVGPEPATVAVWNATNSTLEHFSIREVQTKGVSGGPGRGNPGGSLSSRVGTISGAAGRSVVLFPRGENPPPLPMRVLVSWRVSGDSMREAEGSVRRVVEDSSGASDEVLVFRIDGGGLTVLLSRMDELPVR